MDSPIRVPPSPASFRSLEMVRPPSACPAPGRLSGGRLHGHLLWPGRADGGASAAQWKNVGWGRAVEHIAGGSDEGFPTGKACLFSKSGVFQFDQVLQPFDKTIRNHGVDQSLIPKNHGPPPKPSTTLSAERVAADRSTPRRTTDLFARHRAVRPSPRRSGDETRDLHRHLRDHHLGDLFEYVPQLRTWTITVPDRVTFWLQFCGVGGRRARKEWAAGLVFRIGWEDGRRWRLGAVFCD